MTKIITDDPFWVWYSDFRDSNLLQWKRYFFEPDQIEVTNGPFKGDLITNNKKYPPVEDVVGSHAVFRLHDGFDRLFPELFDVLKEMVKDIEVDPELTIESILKQCLNNVKEKVNSRIKIVLKIRSKDHFYGPVLLRVEDLLWYEDRMEKSSTFRFYATSLIGWKVYQSLQNYELDPDTEFNILLFCLRIINGLNGKQPSKSRLRKLIGDQLPTRHRTLYVQALSIYLSSDLNYSDFLTEYIQEIKTEEIPGIENEFETPRLKIRFSAFEWATIFYYADETKLTSKSNIKKERMEEFIREHDLGITPNNIKTKYHEAKKRINEKRDYPIDKLQLLIPFLKEKYPRTVTKVKNDITFLEEERG